MISKKLTKPVDSEQFLRQKSRVDIASRMPRMTENISEYRNQDLETLSGTVERVSFYSEESGFCVLRVHVRGQRELVPVVGTIASVSAGEWVEARGIWDIDPRHGRQFKARFLKTAAPNTVEGMQKYLGSGLIKGIGPGMAQRLIKAFGLQVFEVIERYPQRLIEAEGIGPHRRDSIVATWAEQKQVRDIMVFLHSHGVGASRAFRIYKTYGDQAIDMVREDPYRLARDIWGIGFKTADQIASSLGIAGDSSIRARAGVEYALQQLTESGHCAYPRDRLADAAAELLEIDIPIIERALDEAIASGRLAQYDTESDPLVYLSALDFSERQLARYLCRLNEGPHPCPKMDATQALEWVQKKTGLKLADAQKRAVELAILSKVLIVTGGPGVGKTTLVNALLKIFQARGLAAVLCAPTGRAAKRMSESTGFESRTIHRLLEFDPRANAFKHDQKRPLAGDFFVVDEFSMVDLVLAYQLIRSIPEHAALVIVGDVDQLPSVGPGCVLRDLIDSQILPVARLDQVFRQAAQSTIITNAHRINQGKMPLISRPPEASDQMADFYFISCEEPERGVDMIVRLIRDRIPARMELNPVQDVQVISPMQRGKLGVQNLNRCLQDALNPGEPGVERFGWRYRRHDKVIQGVNNYDKDVFNGDIGQIVEINEEFRRVCVRFDDRLISYDFGELDELSPAYAISVHKSQGSEYPAVVIPLHVQHYMLLQRNLLYTAVTRGRKLVVIVGSRRALAIAVNRIDSGRRITTLRQRLCEASGRQS